MKRSSIKYFLRSSTGAGEGDWTLAGSSQVINIGDIVNCRLEGGYSTRTTLTVGVTSIPVLSMTGIVMEIQYASLSTCSSNTCFFNNNSKTSKSRSKAESSGFVGMTGGRADNANANANVEREVDVDVDVHFHDEAGAGDDEAFSGVNILKFGESHE